MNPAELWKWYNVGYVGVFLLGLMFLVISLMGLEGGGGDADHDVDHDVDHDMDHDVDHDADVSHDHDADAGHDHEQDHEHEHDAEHEMEHSFFHNLMTLIGLGRCPLSIIIMSFCFLFSLIGFGSNLLLKPMVLTPVIYGSVSYVLAFIVGFFLTGALARLIGKVLPTKETFVHEHRELVGKTGKAVYDFQDGKGFIQVHDASGTLLEKKAFCPDSQINKGEQVVISRWDKENNGFLVVAAPKDLTLP